MHRNFVKIIGLIHQPHRHFRVVGIPRSPIFSVIAVKHFPPGLLAAGVYLPVTAYHGCKIQDHQQIIRRVFALAAINDHALIAMLQIYPFKSIDIELVFVQPGLAPQQPVQVTDAVLEQAMTVIFQQAPGELGLVIPFRRGAEFIAHKKQFSAGMGHHIGIQQAQVGKFLPVIARHLIEHRRFSVDHFIMAQREDEVLVKVVRHTEAELVLVVATEDGVKLEVVEGIVHPAHHPLHPEAKSVRKGWLADARPVRCLFRNGLYIRKIPVNHLVEIFYKGDRFQVAIPAMFIWLPFSCFPGVIQLEHRADRVHPQTVDMIVVQPVAGIAGQKRFDFPPFIIEDIAVPVRVKSLAHIRIFIGVCTVEKI